MPHGCYHAKGCAMDSSPTRTRGSFAVAVGVDGMPFRYRQCGVGGCGCSRVNHNVEFHLHRRKHAGFVFFGAKHQRHLRERLSVYAVADDEACRVAHVHVIDCVAAWFRHGEPLLDDHNTLPVCHYAAALALDIADPILSPIGFATAQYRPPSRLATSATVAMGVCSHRTPV